MNVGDPGRRVVFLENNLYFTLFLSVTPQNVIKLTQKCNNFSNA